MKKILLFIVMFLPCFIFANQVSNSKYMWDDINANNKIDQDDEVCFYLECFNVIDNDGEKLTMLAKYNLYAGYLFNEFDIYEDVDKNNGLYPKQNEEYSMRYTGRDYERVFPSTAMFFSDDWYWDAEYSPKDVYSKKSNFYEPLNVYKNYLKDNGININNIRLLNLDDLDKLSYRYDEDSNYFVSDDYSHRWIYNTAFFTGIQFNEEIYITGPTDEIILDYYDEYYGIRPVIEIDLEELNNVVYADEVYIKKIELIDKTSTASSVGMPKLDGLNIELNTVFSKLNDNIKYKITIYNNTDTLYYLKKGLFENSSSFMKYSFEVNQDILEPNSEMEIIVNVSYDKEVTEFVDNYYFEFDDSLIELSDILLDDSKKIEEENVVNPFTVDSLVFIIITLGVSGFVLYKTRNKKLVLKVLIIGTILTPVLTIGKNYVSYSVLPEEVGEPKITINFKCNVKVIDNGDNIIISRNIDSYAPLCTSRVVSVDKKNISGGIGSGCELHIFGDYYDMWDYNYIGAYENVIFKVGDFVPDNYEKSWDITVNKSGNVMAYAVLNNNDLYDLYIVGRIRIEAGEDFSFFFDGMNNLKSIENIELLDTSKTLFMTATFSEISVDNLDLTSLDLSKVRNMDWLFNESSINNLNMSNMDLSSLESAIGMFSHMESNTIDFSSSTFKKLTSFEKMFYGAKIKNLNLTAIDTSNIRGMSYMFGSSEIDNLIMTTFDTSNVGWMLYMFYGAKINDLDFSLIKPQRWTDISGMFGRFVSNNVDLSSWDFTNQTNLSAIFENAKIDKLNISNSTTKNVLKMNNMFKNATIGELILDNIDTFYVKDMSYMFYNSNIGSVDLSSLNTSKVTDMSYMFYGSNINNLDLSSFNTSNVTDMTDMFAYCSYDNLDLSSFNTISLKNMRYMFAYYEGTTIDLSSFDTSNVTVVDYSFAYSNNLRTIYVSDKWSNSSINSSSRMFYNSTKLVGGNGTTYSSSHVDKTYARIDKPGTPGYFTLKN